MIVLRVSVCDLACRIRRDDVRKQFFGIPKLIDEEAGRCRDRPQHAEDNEHHGNACHDSSNKYHTREPHGGNIWAIRDDFLRVVGAAL